MNRSLLRLKKYNHDYQRKHKDYAEYHIKNDEIASKLKKQVYKKYNCILSINDIADRFNKLLNTITVYGLQDAYGFGNTSIGAINILLNDETRIFQASPLLMQKLLTSYERNKVIRTISVENINGNVKKRTLYKIIDDGNVVARLVSDYLDLLENLTANNYEKHEYELESKIKEIDVLSSSTFKKPLSHLFLILPENEFNLDFININFLEKDYFELLNITDLDSLNFKLNNNSLFNWSVYEFHKYDLCQTLFSPFKIAWTAFSKKYQISGCLDLISLEYPDDIHNIYTERGGVSNFEDTSKCYHAMQDFVLNFYKYLTTPNQIVYAPQPETIEPTRKMKASEKLNLKSYTFLDVKPEVIIKKEPIGTHKSPEPHLRRGHYRRQRYGKGLEQEKLIFIPELKVNDPK